MNKKFEDVKINTKRIPIKKIEKEVPDFKNTGNHNPTYSIPSEDKYQFLDKRVKKDNARERRIFPTPLESKPKRKLRTGFLLFFILTLIGLSFYLFSTVFFHANITVMAKNQNFELKGEEFSAEKEKSINSVPFTLTMVSGSDYKDIVLSSSKEASEKAKGSITLYNEYSSKSVKIIANSFISDENGKTYKTDSTVSIPGFTLDKNKKVIPGKISVNITAFLSGEAYNGNPKDFTINSYKGTDKFKKIYGKAETALTGGMTGLVYIMDDKQKLEIESMDFSKFKEKLLNKIEVPSGYVLYSDTVKYDVDFNKNLISKSPDVKLEIKGTAKALLLQENVLADYIVERVLPNISPKEKAQIIRPNISNLKFKFTNENQVVDKDLNNFDFKLSGEVLLKWDPYTEELKNNLLGKDRNNTPSIFKEDPGISSASVKIIPFWSKKLPSDINKINIQKTSIFVK